MVNRFDSFGLKDDDDDDAESRHLHFSQEIESQSILQSAIRQNNSQESSGSTLNEASSSSGNSKLGNLIPEPLVTSDPRGKLTRTRPSRGATNDAKDQFAVRLTSIFILEFGIIFHSVFIGLTLAVTSNDNFNVLYIALVFHQCFEGLGLGTRLADVPWPSEKTWIPWALGISFGLTTPIAIATGLAMHNHFVPGSQEVLIVNGIFDAISAGILIYTGLVELMAHDFMFNNDMRKASTKSVLFAYLQICFGAGLMAVLGKWA
ncbi:hypothetical protein K3495_g1898 [Podosphaera aphanis]|nr:hypothetical protein K3495_g1898 [Podosphaera aphanis]